MAQEQPQAMGQSQGNGHEVDPKDLPRTEEERRRKANELKDKAMNAFRSNQPLVATLCATDALLLYPNEREYLEVFDEIVLASQDPLSLLPVATGAVHVATAAGRARVLMMQKRLPEAIELLGRVIEVAPDVPYVDWLRRWMQPHVIPKLDFDLLMKSVVKPVLTMAVDVPVPPKKNDPRLPNVASAAEIFAALLPHFGAQKVVHAGLAICRRRLGDTAATLAAADEGVRRFPDDWGLRTALLNALRDAKRPDEALSQARVAMQIDPQDFSPLHDAAWGFLDAGRPQEAAQLFAELLQRDPRYPGGQACMHYARFKAAGSEEDRRALMMMRERAWWDERACDMANELDPPVPYYTQLPGPGDASANYARMLVDELGEVMRCCGRGAQLTVGIQSKYPESPSVGVAFDHAMRTIGGGGASMTIEVGQVQNPSPWQNKGQVAYPVWAPQQGGGVRPVHTQTDPRAQHAIGTIAAQLFRREVWDPAARQVSMQAGAAAMPALLAVLTNPPPAPQDFDGITWTMRCQVATALVLSHFGPWESGPGRGALYSLVSGPSDWTTIAGIVALGWRAFDAPHIRQEVEQVFGWLRTQIPAEGFTPWEDALIHTWLGLGSHPDAVRADLEAWAKKFDDTVEDKNAVRTLRRYGGLTIEDYARFSLARDKIVGGLGYAGVGAALVGFSPPPALVQLCQKYNVPPNRPFIDEWQQALNANPRLMDQFIEIKRTIEFEQMGITAEEKGALDNILQGNMDMHQRMAQAQQAQAAVAAGDAGDPDPVVFPGQRVAKLSDYVRILKGMQTGNMMGALAQYGLDMMSYGQVAQAWGAKMAADPVLTDKFSRMMNS